MIIDYCFKNIKSFKEEQNFSMRRGTSIELEKPSIVRKSLPSEGLNRVSAVFGANASGKSNFLKSIMILKSFIENGVIYDVDFANSNEPSVFEIVFSFKGKKYNYNLKVQKDKVIYEKLSYYASNQPTQIFEYKTDPRHISLSDLFSEKEKNAIEFNSQNHKNSPILFQFKDSDSIEAKNAFLFFASGIIIREIPENNNAAAESKIRQAVEDNVELRNFYNSIISSADLGIKNVKLIDTELGTESEMNKKQLEIIADAIIKINEIDGNKLSDEDKEKLRQSFKKIKKKASFTHKINDDLVNLDIRDESRGTIAASNIFLDLQEILENGATYIVDEIDCSLHPTIVTQLINIFNSEDTNPNNAQLLFTTHDISILDSSIYGENILDRDQVWFTEKNELGQSSLYSLLQFKGTRKEDNLYKKYISGRYGATPKASLYYGILNYWENKKGR